MNIDINTVGIRFKFGEKIKYKGLSTGYTSCYYYCTIYFNNPFKYGARWNQFKRNFYFQHGEYDGDLYYTLKIGVLCTRGGYVQNRII